MRTRSDWVIRNVGWAKPLSGTIFDDYFRDQVYVSTATRPAIDSGLIDDWQLQDLVMCPLGGGVRGELTGTGYTLTGRHAALIKKGRHNEVEIRRDGADHFLWVEWTMFDDSAPTGFGCCALLRAAQAAQRLGLVRMELLAAGGNSSKGLSWNPGFWGYYSWPRFGFNCPLEPGMRGKVQAVPHLAACQDVLDVMDKDAAWWKANGDGDVMTFDLAENSRSWQTLRSYVGSKGFMA